MGSVAKTAGRTGLQVRDLSHAYGGRQILDRLSFTVRPGRALALTGPNGSGKTTLLRCVVGAERPASGQVLLDGTVVDETSPEVRRNVATLLDDVEFLPDVSVVEHLDLVARAHATPDGEAVVDALLEELSLAVAADQLPITLSSGQRRRLCLAACFARPRRLLVLDEPEARLDAAGRSWLAERLRADTKSGVAILLASHDAELVEAVADDVLDLAAP